MAQRDSLSFLDGGGEIADRIRRKTDWDERLGPPQAWPDSLRTALSIALASRFPHLLWWGPELFVLYNDAYIPIFGPKHPDVLGRPGVEAWGEVWDVIGPMFEQVRRGGEATWSEDQRLDLRRHGFTEETYFTWSYSAIRGERGEVGGIWTSVVETTERVIQDRRRETIRRVAAQVAGAQDPWRACADAAAACSANPYDLPFLRLWLAEPDGTSLRCAASVGGIDAMDDAPAWPLTDAVAQGRSIVLGDVRERFGDVPSAPWPEPVHSAVVVPLRKPGGFAHGVLVTGVSARQPFDSRDLSFFELVAQQVTLGLDSARAHEEERRRAEALAELDRAKTKFFSNVSHELRTPLTLLLAPLEEAVGNLAVPAAERESLVVAHRNALRLLKLVNGLLDFARIEAGRLRAVREPTDLAALTREVASAFELPMSRAGLRYTVRCEDVGAVPVDRDIWEKVVLNLLSNAFKFTLEGEVELSLSRRDDHIRLVVRDTGVGVPASEVPRLFERFHRIDATHGRTHEGTGIGLSLTQELVKLHHGTIEASSELGRGTTFTVEIAAMADAASSSSEVPRRAFSLVPPKARTYVEEALRWLPEPSERVSPLSGPSSGRVLVADDNADMRSYVARLLGDRWTVETAPDGEAALAAIAQNPPDVLVTDVMMPKLDGFGLLARIRGDAATRHLAVLMLSARAGEEARSEGIEAGADDYLVKPFAPRELAARVQSLVSAAQAKAIERRHARFLDALIRDAPVAIAVWRGPEHVFEVANPRYLQVFGRADVVGKRVRDVFPEPEVAAVGVFDIWDRVYATGETFHAPEYEVRFDRRGDGTREPGWFSFTLTRLQDEEGAVTRLLAVAVDITEQVSARKRIDALRQTAEAASRAKDEFLSVLSHELRTPLNAIIGWSTLLRAGAVRPENTPAAFDTIERNARVQARLIEDMLDLARIEQGKVVLSVGPVEMVRIVEAALDAVRPAADAKGVRLQPVLDSHATIIGDPDRLQQVVWNLLSNAIKFTPRGGRVQVQLRREPSFVEIVVADTGQGIAPEFLPHVFDRFRQADASSTRTAGGLGLGLAIVRSLVELHGGNVAAASDGLGKGASFTVRLPMAPVRADHAPSPAASSEPPVPTFECPPSLAGKRILVLDDERETRELLRYVIVQCDAAVETASSVDEALAALAREPFDILVSDIGMPQRDGFELIRQIRSTEAAYARIPAIALTAYARVEDRTRALREGFDFHLAKPIDPAELVAVLGALAARR